MVGSMVSRSNRASSGISTGVLPFLVECFGPRTAVAGLNASTPPVASQSNSILTAARCCFTVGGETSLPSCSTQAATWTDETFSIDVRPWASAHRQKSPTARP